MNNRAAFTGTKVSAATAAPPPLVGHCLQRDVGGRQVCVIKWEEESEETSAEDRTETVAAAPPPLLIRNCFEKNKKKALMDSLTDSCCWRNTAKSALKPAGRHKSASPRLRLGPTSSFGLHFDAFTIPSLATVPRTAQSCGQKSDGKSNLSQSQLSPHIADFHLKRLLPTCLFSLAGRERHC